ncbi:MAG: hypothetical protein FJ098_09300, partial [Deltaproteobacteria bacterium]|nr:hypothetical protein [Deltaproteobacteria bacterium]
MDVDTRRKDHLFQTAFPHPVAAPYRMAVSAHNPMERLAHLVATVDGLARYLATVTLADLFRQAPPADRVRELAASMQVATPAGWMRLLEELLVSRPDADWFLRPLATRLLRSGGKPARALTDLRRLGEAAEAFFGAREATDPEQAREAVALLEPEVHQNLAPLAFLADYPVGVIRAQAGGAGDTAFLGSFNRWMGHRTAPLPISVALDSTPPLDMVLVASPEFDRILVLNPFAQVREDGETSRFFLLSGMHDQRSLRLSSYTGHRITAVPLEVEGVPVDLPVWMGAWTEGAALASLAPSRDTVSRMRTRSRLLPDEKVFDGAFTNLGFIGRGGIGAVYRLVEGSTGEDRAVKILYPDLGRNEVFTRYFIET